MAQEIFIKPQEENDNKESLIGILLKVLVVVVVLVLLGVLMFYLFK